ncbi:MAG: hypothetical protein ACLGH3_07595 [Actinomycetota bacterium]
MSTQPELTFVEYEVELDNPDLTESHFEQILDLVAEELEVLGVQDPSVWCHIGSRLVGIEFVHPGPIDEIHALVRTVLHAARVGTPGWPAKPPLEDPIATATEQRLNLGHGHEPRHISA